ncbi:MAG: hypothetical protein COA52_00605 [Hyphomicrobiales bacterium]|nr:MAG: hypothetical protein COA52_00605 [Hyphomicrobiales bacterium]
MKITNEEDFGFFHETQESIKKDNRAEKLYEEIIPFLNKLKGNEGTDTINWPSEQRIEQIDKFITKLEGILNESH